MLFFQAGLVFQGSLQIKYVSVPALTVPFFLPLVQIVQSMTELCISLLQLALQKGSLSVLLFSIEINICIVS